MKTISEIVKDSSRKYYFYLGDAETGERFQQQCVREGFAFGDGVPATVRKCARVMNVSGDKTINFVGVCGMMAFGASKEVCGKELVKIDFRKVLNDEENILYSRAVQ
ncbi:MAG: hypothetical protein LUE22_09175 [Oscillospiraceae bacterium]|nr:hypothetical protein [Oscillospiraceae bacterium]